MNRADKSLIIFDMDGVLTQHYSSWQFVHDCIGVNNRENYELFKGRKLSYQDFLESDVKLWKERVGTLKKSDIQEYLSKIPIRENLSEAMSSLKGYDTCLAIVSAGISWLSDRINEIFTFDYVFSNTLSTSATGDVLPHGTSVVDPLKKGLVVRQLQERIGIGKSNTISVGDSVQDIPMFKNSIFSVGFNSREDEVKRSASTSLESNNLLELAKIIEENCLIRS